MATPTLPTVRPCPTTPARPQRDAARALRPQPHRAPGRGPRRADRRAGPARLPARRPARRARFGDLTSFQRVRLLRDARSPRRPRPSCSSPRPRTTGSCSAAATRSTCSPWPTAARCWGSPSSRRRWPGRCCSSRTSSSAPAGRAATTASRRGLRVGLGAGAAAPPARGPRRRLAGVDEEGLGGEAERPLPVVEDGPGQPPPVGPTRVTASRSTHSPAGSRCRWTVRSVLTKRKRSKSRTRLTPLAKSAAAATRATGAVGSPATSGRASRNQVRAGPGPKSVPAAKRRSMPVRWNPSGWSPAGCREGRALGGLRAAGARRRGAVLQPRRQRHLDPAQPDGADADQRTPVLGRRLGLDELEAPSRLRHRGSDAERGERHGPEELVREARDLQLPRAGLGAGDRLGQDAGGARRRGARRGPTARGRAARGRAGRRRG